MDATGGTRAKRRLVRAGLVLAGLLVALALAEIALALLGLPRFPEAHSVPTQFAFPRTDDGDVLVYTNAPSSTIPFVYDGDPRGYFGPACTVEHPTNAAGFRGPEFAEAKPADAFRIAFLGDSFTFGEGVRFEDTYPERTARLLQDRHGPPPPRFESLSFAVGGFDTTQELLLLERTVLRFAPDLVVVGYVLNDAEPPLYRRDPATGGIAVLDRGRDFPKGRAAPRPPDQPLYLLRTARFLWQLAQSRSRTERTIAYYRSLFGEREPGWRESREALRGIAERCRERGIPCVVVCFPILVELDGDYPFEAIHGEVRAAAESAGAVFVDLLPAFRGRSATSLWVHPTDQHPNEIAHGIAARALADALIERGLAP